LVGGDNTYKLALVDKEILLKEELVAPLEDNRRKSDEEYAKIIEELNKLQEQLAQF
jgi:hypothetical protein